MTKTEKLDRARRVRKMMAGFIYLQDAAEQERVRREWKVNPDYSAMNRLVSAQHELQLLIEDLQKEGYGTGYGVEAG